MNKIYAFKYCDCIHESAYATISLHRTKSGAYSAMRKHLLNEWSSSLEKHHNWKKWEYFRNDHPLEFQRWCVSEIEIKE